MIRQKQIMVLSSINAASSTAVVATFPCPVEILDVKLVSETIGDANTACNVAVTRRTIAGNSSSGTTANYTGTFVIPANSSQGSVFYDSGIDSLKELVLEAGDQLAIAAVNVSTNVHTLVPCIEYVVLDQPRGSLADGVDV